MRKTVSPLSRVQDLGKEVRLLIVACCLLCITASSGLLAAEPTVGIEAAVEVLLPGPELKAKPAEKNAPMTVRIASTRPHGTLISYDLRYSGLIPGKHDLRSYLLRPDGSPAQDLPPIEVTVAGILPKEHQGQLVAAVRSPFAFLGGYRWVMGGVAAFWLLAAVPLLFLGRHRKGVTEVRIDDAPPTLAERLRPLVERAGAGKLTTGEKAELERLLLAHWRERLKLEDLSVTEALAHLRTHPEAGALLRTLEDWLHRRPGTAQVDVESALAPYANHAPVLPVDERIPVPSNAP